MARVTVEDCLEHMENRFALVHAAALRSNELIKGATPLHKCKNKEIVTALREIADGTIELQGDAKEKEKPRPKKKAAAKTAPKAEKTKKSTTKKTTTKKKTSKKTTAKKSKKK